MRFRDLFPASKVSLSLPQKGERNLYLSRFYPATANGPLR